MMSSAFQGKNIKNYALDQTICLWEQMTLVSAVKDNNTKVTVLAFEKAKLDQQSFVSWHNTF